MQVTTKYGNKTAAVEYDFGKSLDESVEAFGEKTVHDHFIRNAKIALQGLMSRMLKAGKSEQEIQQAAKEFTLEGRRPAKSKADKARELYDNMSPEEREAFKQQLAGGGKK